jgi:hypothetical protein
VVSSVAVGHFVQFSTCSQDVVVLDLRHLVKSAKIDRAYGMGASITAPQLLPISTAHAILGRREHAEEDRLGKRRRILGEKSYFLSMAAGRWGG